MGNTTSVTPGLLLKGLNEVFWQEYNKKTRGRIKSDEIFNFNSVDRGMTETDVALAAVSEYQITQEDKNINKQLVKERGQTIYQHDIFSNGFDISYKMLLADESGKNAIQQAAQLGLAGRESQDKKRMGVLRNGGTTIGLDGKALFATDHPLADSTTQSNDISFNTSLYQTIKDGMKALRNQKQYNAELSIGRDAAQLICPSALWDKIVEVVEAKGIPGSDNNDVNFIAEKFPGLRVGWSPYLGAEFGGSDTKFYLLADKTMHKLKVMTREALNTWMNPWQEHDNIVTKFNAKYVESFGFSDYLGTVRCASA